MVAIIFQIIFNQKYFKIIYFYFLKIISEISVLK